MRKELQSLSLSLSSQFRFNRFSHFFTWLEKECYRHSLSSPRWHLFFSAFYFIYEKTDKIASFALFRHRTTPPSGRMETNFMAFAWLFLVLKENCFVYELARHKMRRRSDASKSTISCDSSSSAVNFSLTHFIQILSRSHSNSQYSGTNADLSKADSVIFRSDIFNSDTGKKEYPFRRTLRYDSKWLDSEYRCCCCINFLFF